MASKRDRLVETAERLFYRDGFHATGIDRIVAEAGIARMTLYKHFPSKDDLVLAVLEKRERAYWDALETAAEDARAARGDPLLAVVEAHGRWLCGPGRHGCIHMKAIGEYGTHVPRIADAAAGHKRRLLAFLQGLVPAQAQPEAAAARAEQTAMLMEGATAFAQILAPEAAVRQTVAAAQRLLSAPDDGALA